MLDAVVTVYGVVMGASPLLQGWRVLHRRHSDDVSLSMLGIICVGGALWLAYGLSHGLPAVIIANVVGVVANVVTIALCLRYRHAPEVVHGEARQERPPSV